MIFFGKCRKLLAVHEIIPFLFEEIVHVNSLKELPWLDGQMLYVYVTKLNSRPLMPRLSLVPNTPDRNKISSKAILQAMCLSRVVGAFRV